MAFPVDELFDSSFLESVKHLRLVARRVPAGGRFAEQRSITAIKEDRHRVQIAPPLRNRKDLFFDGLDETTRTNNIGRRDPVGDLYRPHHATNSVKEPNFVNR